MAKKTKKITEIKPEKISTQIITDTLELGGLGLKLGIGQGLILLLQGIHLVRNGIDGLQLPLRGRAEDLGKQTHIRKTPLGRDLLSLFLSGAGDHNSAL